MNTVRTIIFINILVFLAWNISGVEPDFMVNNFLVSWDGLMDGRIWTLITSVFSHNMFLHILINMYVLNSFGPIVLMTIGKRNFLIFYFGAGIFSSFCHAFISAFVLGHPEWPALGASGAIAGLILLFALLYPKEKLLLMGVIPMPAVWGAIAFVGLDIWGLVAQAGGHGLPIGHGAHLGGALAGMIYYLYIRKKLKTRLI